MAKVQRVCMSIFFILLICHGGFAEPDDQNDGEPELFGRDGGDEDYQNAGEPELFEREPDDQNDGEPEYVPAFLELFGKLQLFLTVA